MQREDKISPRTLCPQNHVDASRRAMQVWMSGAAGFNTGNGETLSSNGFLSYYFGSFHTLFT